MRSEQRLYLAWREHRLINAINHVIFEMDEGGHWTFLNPAWTRLSGYSISDCLASDFRSYLHADDRGAADELLQRALAGENPQAFVRLQTRDGGTGFGMRWISIDARLAPSENGGLATIVGTLSDASAQKDVEARLQRQNRESLARLDRQVTLSARVVQEIASGKPLGELYDWFVNAVNETFGYYHTQLFDFNRSDETATLTAASGEHGRRLVNSRLRVAAGDGVVGKTVATAESVLHPDAVSDPDWQTHALLPGIKSELAVPILLGNNILGVLAVFSDTVGSLDQEDLLLVEGLAGPLAMAIESMQLRQEMEERMAELDNLQRLMRREAWLHMQATHADGVRGYRFDRRLMAPVAAAEAGLAAINEKQGPNLDRQKTTLASPLQIRGQTFGVLGIENDPDNPMTPAERELLEAISLQVAEAMENARLLEQTQKRAVELETVARVSTATSTILEKDKLLQGVVELTRRSFNLYHAHIYLLNPDSGELILAAGSGEAGQQMVKDGWRINLDHPRSVVAHSARARKGIIVNDVRKETGFLRNPLLPATRSELAVPMISGNRLLGVLDVQADVPNYFTQDDVRIQSALAGQVATALQNATLYQEQIETSEKLREFDRLKSEFLASMSHELRTPLNSIIGFADVLLEGIDGVLNERMEEDVQLIRNSGQHLRELIGDILDMSKIEAGMMELRYEAIDIATLRHEIEGFARTQLMTYDKVLDFKLRIGNEVGLVEADLTRFKQVLFNLVSNAIKFTARGGVTLSMNRKDGKLVVRVEDTGIGIKEENIPIIFEQFRQVDGSLTRTAGGTGLGLPISKSLVELHGGDIWVESEVGKGTSFYFSVPLERSRPRRTQAPGKSTAAEATPE